MSLTTNRNDECLLKIRPDGQQECYLVLSDEELAKGFVRPVRTSYKHVGPPIACEGVDGKVYEAGHSGGCGTLTTMGQKLAETYARNPKFYSATFCCQCGTHLPVCEFVWFVDGSEVGS